MVEAMPPPAGVTSRAQRAAEIAGRIALVVFAATVLPKVFPADVQHFRDLANCVAAPDHHVLTTVCNHKHFDLHPLGTGFNAPFRSVRFEFPPVSTLLLVLVGRWVGPLLVARLLFGGVLAAFELASLRALRRAWPEHAVRLSWWWHATVLPVALLAWFRMDFLAVFLATEALVGLELARRRTGSIVLGWLAKLWPVTVVAGLVVRRRWSEAVAAFAGVAVVTGVWFALAPKGFRAFLTFRAGKGLEVESLLAGFQFFRVHGHAAGASGAWVLNNGWYEWANPALTACLVAFAAACLVRAWRPGADVVALCGALTVAAMVFSRILSAQYVVWVAPFAVLVAARGNRRVGWSYLAAGWLTLAYLLWFDPAMISGNRLLMFVVCLRNVALLALMLELFRAIRPAAEPAP